MIMCVLLCYPVSIHMLQLLSTGRPISSSSLHCSTINIVRDYEKSTEDEKKQFTTRTNVQRTGLNTVFKRH